MLEAFNEAHDRARDKFFVPFVEVATGVTGAPQPPIRQRWTMRGLLTSRRKRQIESDGRRMESPAPLRVALEARLQALPSAGRRLRHVHGCGHSALLRPARRLPGSAARLQPMRH